MFAHFLLFLTNTFNANLSLPPPSVRNYEFKQKCNWMNKDKKHDKILFFLTKLQTRIKLTFHGEIPSYFRFFVNK